jgi:hypothetical protein
MAYDAVTQRVYAGSAVARTIVWTDRSGTLHDFAAPGANQLGNVLGVHLDARRRNLWAVSTGGAGADAARIVRGLFEYDLASGRLLARYAIPDTIGEITFNDVVVDPATGIAYTTRTTTGSVYSATPGDTTLREIVPAGSIPQANGITIDPEGRSLFIAGGLGVVRYDLRTRQLSPVRRAPGVVDVTIDGLYWFDGSLIGIQNGVHPGRVVRLYLDSSRTRFTSMDVLETYNPLLDGPTTGDVRGGAFYFMANPQGRRRFENGGVIDSTTLAPVIVLRLPLRGSGRD